jgi:surface protein
MSTFNYPFDKLYGPGTTCSIDLVAGTTYTFDITNNTGSSYFVLETVRDYNGVTPKNLSGSLTNFLNIAYHVADDYKAGFVLPTSTNSFDFTPANNVVKETLMFRGTGGIILGTGAFSTTASFRVDTAQAGVTSNDQFQLPLINTSPINFTIDWGDGITNTITSYNQPETLHTYTTPGEYFITITSGIIKGWQFAGSGDAVKLMEVYDWSKWDFDVDGAFRGCENLVSSATSVPTAISSTSLNNMFQDTTNFNGPLNGWDVSGVQTFNEVFRGATSFNQPLNNWDVSSATSMNGMFRSATSFNQPLNNWDVSLVTDMSEMFSEASSFNQDISSWNVSLVTDMSEMFSVASSFNQPLDSWDVGEVLSMYNMFFSAVAFNQPLNNWDVSKVTNMEAMFNIALAFNQPLDNWDVSSVTSMRGMFYGTLMTFNQNIGGWDVSNVTNLVDFLGNSNPSSFSTTNLNAIYNGWSQLTLQPNVVVEFENVKYTAAGAAGKAILTSAPNNWVITDGGQV